MGFFDLGWTAWIIAAVLLGIGAIALPHGANPDGMKFSERTA
jgi:hypothetical protein